MKITPIRKFSHITRKEELYGGGTGIRGFWRTISQKGDAQEIEDIGSA
jgi:hypothetical protein